MKTIVLAFFTVFIVACSNNDDIKTVIIKEFPKYEVLTGEHVDLFPVPFCPGKISIIDTLLIKINSTRCEDDFFYVYNKNSSEFLGSFGTKGRGPNEFLYPHNTGQYIIKNGSINLWIHDVHQRIIDLVDINKSMKEKKIVISERLKEPLSINQGIDVLILPDSNLIGRSMSPEGRFFYYNTRNDLTEWVEYFPKVSTPPFSEHNMHNLYYGPTRIKPDNSRIVSALGLFKRIDVFSINLDHLFSIVFDDSPQNPDFYTNPDNPIPRSLMHYYSDMFLSDRYIYALNINVSQKERIEGIVTALNELHVFSWDGDPVACYRLNQTLYSFTIDEEDDYLYGLTRATGDEFESQVVRFKLQ